MPGTADQILLHAKMYQLADKYDVVGLKPLVSAKFKRACNSYWDSEHFPLAAHHVFSTTPESDVGLRKVVSETIATHRSLLEKAEVRAVIAEFKSIAFDLVYLTIGNTAL